MFSRTYNNGWIAWRSIAHRRLASGLTAFSMSLGAALVVMIILIHGVISDSFNRGSQGYDLLVAPKGSSLEVVLSSVFYVRPPVGTLPESYLRELRSGKYAHAVELAIPVAIGHHFRACPIVGTRPEFFSKLEYMDGRKYRFAQGANLDVGGDFSAVLGARAAQKAGLRIGDEFAPTAEENPGCSEPHRPFKVVGILAPTGTPNDNAIFVNLDGFYGMHAHGDHTHGETANDAPAHGDHDHGDHAHDAHEHPRVLSAILVLLKQRRTSARFAEQQAAPTTDGEPGTAAADPTGSNAASDTAQRAGRLGERLTTDFTASQLAGELDKLPDVQAVSPIKEVRDLLDNLVGNIQTVLLMIGSLVIVVAGIGMMVSIYNSMSERRHEIAVMRALGAQRTTVMGIILLESILLSLGGGACGLLFGHLLTAALSPFISSYTGVVIRFWDFQTTELLLVPGLILLASLVGYLPAVIAYRTDVATSLGK